MSTLWVYAHETEGGVIAADLGLCLKIGTGKAAAAAALARELSTNPPAYVVAFGVAGAYPNSGLSVGDVCLVGDDWLVDDGVCDERGFRDLGAMGLGDPGPFHADSELVERFSTILGAPIVRGATVSTCSATDALSVEFESRTGAAVETMEGAAIGLACTAAAVPWVQVRAISNFTGDRSHAGWDRERAVAALHRAIRVILATPGISVTQS